jgi:hypothetical protein
MSSLDNHKPLKPKFEAAKKGERQIPASDKPWSQVQARRALEAAIKALGEIESKGQLSEEGKQARDLCQKALAGVPDRVKNHRPKQQLRPGGALAAAADRVDRRVRESGDARRARTRSRRRRDSDDRGR